MFRTIYVLLGLCTKFQLKMTFLQWGKKLTIFFEPISGKKKKKKKFDPEKFRQKFLRIQHMTGNNPVNFHNKINSG